MVFILSLSKGWLFLLSLLFYANGSAFIHTTFSTNFSCGSLEDVEVAAGLGLVGVTAKFHVQDLVEEAEHPSPHLLPLLSPSGSVRRPG